MREVIQGLLEAEGEARRIVQSAREAAVELVAEAMKCARESVEQARHAARAEAAQAILTAVQAAQKERQQRLQNAKVEIERQVCMDEATCSRLADAVVRCICEPTRPAEAPHPNDTWNDK